MRARALAALAAICLGAAGAPAQPVAGGGLAPAASRESSALLVPSGVTAFLWLGSAAGGVDTSTESGAHAAFASIARAGFKGVVLDAIAPDGTRRFATREGAAQLRRQVEAARLAGLECGIAFPAFHAEAKETTGTLQQWAVRRPDGGFGVLGSESVPGNVFPESSPALAAVRARVRADFDSILALRPTFVLLVDFGFESEAADVSAAARDAFERDARVSVKSWPADVAPASARADGAPGGFHARWQVWRAAVLRQLVFDLAGQRSASDPPRLGVIVDGSYRLHLRRGMNWAGRDVDPSWFWNTAPPQYRATNAGHLLDFLVLDHPGAGADAQKAIAAGYRAWAAEPALLEEAGRVAGRRGIFWLVANPRATDAAGFREELAGTGGHGAPILVVPGGERQLTLILTR